MGNRQARVTSPDLLEYLVFPKKACTLGRFEQTLSEAMDPRLYYFMSKQDYIDELREFDRRIFQAESEGSVCCLKYDLRQTEHDLQVISMQASARRPPLQFQLLSYYRRGKKRWMGWVLRVLLPAGTTERFNADLRAGRVPSRLVLVAPVDGNGVPLRMSMGQPVYGSAEGAPGSNQVAVGAHPPGYVAPPGKATDDYVAVPSAPVEGAAAGPPPYSRFEAVGGSQPPVVQKPQMI